MINHLSTVQIEEFEKVISSLGKSLDISKTQYDALVKSYEAVGAFLQNDPVLSQYNPIVTPQGSLRLGTIIQPYIDEGDLDVDLVFRLAGKKQDWTQKDIKDLVGARLKSGRYESMLDKKEGRRCWTLYYRQDSDDIKERYHMDILPSVAFKDYDEQMKQVLTEAYSVNNLNKLAIHITDRNRSDYAIETNPSNWLKSNPDGYALWFADRCKEKFPTKNLLTEDIVPLKQYNPEKTPLQRIVQILKRHRDIMFRDDEDKPISIIITTLAAHAYNGESNILEGLDNVVLNMHQYIKRDKYGNDKIENPLNPEENFADKWIETPEKRTKFYGWLNKVRDDMSTILSSKGSMLWENIGKSFGKPISESANKIYTNSATSMFKSGVACVDTKGFLGTTGKSLNATNTFHGKEK